MASQVEQRLKEQGVIIPSAPAAIGSYVPVVQFGSWAVTSGQLPTVGKEVAFTGKVGREVTEEDGQHAARLCVVNALAQLKAALGDLDRIARVIRVDGFVQSAPGFSAQPLVLNGASNLLVAAFGESGKHTRVAVGVAELPLNAAVEVAIWVELKP